MVVSVAEYRKILNDHISTDAQIVRRIEFLEALCRNVTRQELEAYVKNIKANKKA